MSTGLPAAVIQRAAALTHWVVEDAKTARAFIKRVAAVVPLNVPLRSLSIQELPRRAKGRGAAPSDGELAVLLQPAHAGHDIGLLSEAGLASVADPGGALVAQAHAQGLTVGATARSECADVGAGRQRPERSAVRVRRLPADQGRGARRAFANSTSGRAGTRRRKSRSRRPIATRR